MRGLNCIEFEQHVRQAVESRQPIAGDDLRAHAADCAACRRLWDEHSLLDAAVAEWIAAAPADVDLADAILARHAFLQPDDEDSAADHPVPVQPAASRNGRLVPASQHPMPGDDAPRVSHVRTDSNFRKSAIAVVSAAAVVLLMVAVPTGPPPAEPPTVSTAGPLAPEQPTDAGTADADVETLVRDAGTAYLELARGAASLFSDTVVLIPPQSLPPPDRRGEADAAADDKRPPRPLGREFDPIRRDVGQAIDFLFDTLPANPAPTT